MARRGRRERQSGGRDRPHLPHPLPCTATAVSNTCTATNGRNWVKRNRAPDWRLSRPAEQSLSIPFPSCGWWLGNSPRHGSHRGHRSVDVAEPPREPRRMVYSSGFADPRGGGDGALTADPTHVESGRAARTVCRSDDRARTGPNPRGEPHGVWAPRRRGTTDDAGVGHGSARLLRSGQ